QFIEIQKPPRGAVRLGQRQARAGPFADGAHPQQRKPVHHKQLLYVLHFRQSVENFIDGLVYEALKQRTRPLTVSVCGKFFREEVEVCKTRQPLDGAAGRTASGPRRAVLRTPPLSAMLRAKGEPSAPAVVD